MPMAAAMNKINEVMTPLALTTAPDTVTVTFPANAANLHGKSTGKLVLMADCDWYYGIVSGGPYFKVPANCPFALDQMNNGEIYYVRAVTGTGTLSAMVGY